MKTWFKAIVLLGVFAAFLPIKASGSIPSPISYYSFDETDGSTTLTDSIRGDAGIGTLYGYGESGGTFSPGLIGNALSFNGVSNYVQALVAGESLLQYTVSAWVKLDAFTDWGTILKNWGSSNVGVFHLGLNTNQDIFSNYVGNTDGNVFSVQSGSVSTGVWYNLITTYDGQSGGEIMLYLNGVLVSQNSASGETSASIPYMSMGAKLNDAQTGPGVPAGWLDGSLDEIAFWNLVLTPEQVTTIYTNGENGIGIAQLVPEPSAVSLFLVAGIFYLLISRWRLSRPA